MKKIIFGLLLFGSTLLGGCSSNAEMAVNQDSDKLQVMTTFFPMYDFTRNIVGDEADVTLLVPAGTDSHDFEPSARDIANIKNADVFVYNNENMEMWVPSIRQSLEEGDVKVITATEGMELIEGSCGHDHSHDHDHDEDSHSHSHDEDGHDHDHDEDSHDHDHDEDDHNHDHDEDSHSHSHDEDSHDHDHNEDSRSHSHDHVHELDPHVWLSPYRAMQQVESIRDQLIASFSEKEEAFTANAAAYLEELATLDQEFRDAFDNAERTEFVTQHAAFGYLALDYGLTQVAIAGLTPSEEPSPARLAELKVFAAENDVRFIYFEENASEAIARTLAQEANVELAVLNTLEGVTQDAIDNGENYLSIMRQNLAALRKTTDTPLNAE